MFVCVLDSGGGTARIELDDLAEFFAVGETIENEVDVVQPGPSLQG